MWEVISGAAMLVEGIFLSSIAIVVIVIIVVGWVWLSIYLAYWAYCCLMLSSITFKLWHDGGRRLEVGNPNPNPNPMVSLFVFIVGVIVAVVLVPLLSSFVLVIVVLVAVTTRAKVSGRVGGS